MGQFKSPDFTKMTMSQLRLYFQHLRQLEAVTNGSVSRPLAQGPESEVSDWLDDQYAIIDGLMEEFITYLQSTTFAGRDENFRRCMMVEHEAHLGDDLGQIGIALAGYPTERMQAA